MTLPTVYIQQILQEDNHHFSILWSDQLHQRFNLCDVQKYCPCAGCASKNGQNTEHSADVKAVRIASVGRYAIKITFSQGCSTGIYEFELLRRIGSTAGEKQ